MQTIEDKDNKATLVLKLFFQGLKLFQFWCTSDMKAANDNIKINDQIILKQM